MTDSPWMYFTMEELTCHCGCGRMEMVDSFMAKIVRLRREAGFPFIITSGYRCPNYNTRVSDTGSHGPHTTGHAIDILVNHEQARKLLELLPSDITGIGLNQKGPLNKRFIHLDDLAPSFGPRPNVWTY